MQLRQVMIFAKNMDRMATFYREALGLREIPESRQEGWVEFEAGSARLALHAIPAHIAEKIEIAAPPEAREDTPIKLVFEADDVVAARTHLTSRGAVMFEPRPSGGCDGLDPEGNVFQIVSKKR